MWESADEAAPMELYNSAAQAAGEEAEVTEEAAEEEMEFPASETTGFMQDEAAEGGAGNMSQAKTGDVAEDATASSASSSTSSFAASSGADAGGSDMADATAVDDAEDSEVAESATALMTDAEKKLQNKEMQEFSGDRSGATKEEGRESEGAIRIYENVVIKVTEITEETVSTEKNIFYGMKVKIVKDPTGELPEGTEITVWVAYTASAAYLKGTEYTLNLSYSADRECPYRIV